MKLFILPLLLGPSFILCPGCTASTKKSKYPWDKHGELVVNPGSAIIQHKDGTPFYGWDVQPEV